MGELRNQLKILDTRVCIIEMQLKVLGENNFVPRVKQTQEVDDVKDYYAVIKGRKTGIFTTWDGKDGAEAQVKGFSGASHKKFKTREKAMEFLSKNI